MPVRFAFASLITAVLAAPVAAQPSASSAPRPAEQVKIEVRFISVAEDFSERMGVNLYNLDKKPEITDKGVEVGKLGGRRANNPNEPIFLDDRQLHTFLEALNGDIRTNIQHSPNLIVSNGKTAVWRCTGEQYIGTSKSKSVTTGDEISVRPTITTEGRAVAIALKASMRSLTTEKPLRITTLSLEDELTIPTGHTAVLGGWKRLSAGRIEFGPPVAGSKASSGKHHIQKASYTRAAENVLILIRVTLADQDGQHARREP